MHSLITISQPFAERDAENETREKLVAAAETLFAQRGYQGVSVRAIAAAAGVNWSLLGYYFRGKEGLLFEIYRRHCNALNAERFQLLKAARAECQPPQLEKVIEAFVLPALSVTHTLNGGPSFSRLRAVLAAENSQLLDQLVAANFDSSSAEFIDALCPGNAFTAGKHGGLGQAVELALVHKAFQDILLNGEIVVANGREPVTELGEVFDSLFDP